MKRFLSILLLLCITGGIVGMMYLSAHDDRVGYRDQLAASQDEVARLKQEVRYRDGIIARQAEIIAGYRK